MRKYDKQTPEQMEIEQLQAQGVNGTVARMLIKMQRRIDEQQRLIESLQLHARLSALNRLQVEELIERLKNALSEPFQE